jgi:hypothetical protein
MNRVLFYVVIGNVVGISYYRAGLHCGERREVAGGGECLHIYVSGARENNTDIDKVSPVCDYYLQK